MMQEKTPTTAATVVGAEAAFPLPQENSLKTLHGQTKRLNPQELASFAWTSARERRVRATLPARCAARPLGTAMACLMAWDDSRPRTSTSDLGDGGAA
jgi:hypothetical protein